MNGRNLVSWARSLSGMGKRSGGTEFSSQEALSTYMRQHPKADSSKHSVSPMAQRSAVDSANAHESIAKIADTANQKYNAAKTVPELKGAASEFRSALKQYGAALQNAEHLSDRVKIEGRIIEAKRAVSEIGATSKGRERRGES